jgi:hypothetical protein
MGNVGQYREQFSRYGKRRAVPGTMAKIFFFKKYNFSGIFRYAKHSKAANLPFLTG